MDPLCSFRDKIQEILADVAAYSIADLKKILAQGNSLDVELEELQQLQTKVDLIDFRQRGTWPS